jgi:glycosyltransferase involved in cell wall biosynthesis
MRILHLIPTLGSGGAERQLSLLAPGLVESGVDVHVAFCHSGQNLTRMINSSVSIHQIACNGNHDPFLLLKLIRLINRIKPDVIQTWLLQMDVLGGIAALLTSTPYILSERASSEHYSENWKFKIRYLIGSKANVVVANSLAGANYWLPARINLPTSVIRNAVTSYSLSDKFIHLIRRKPERLILFAGRYAAQKNVLTLIDAFINVASACQDVEFKLFGMGDLSDELLKKVAASGFASNIAIEEPTDCLYDWMSVADLFVSVSHYEGNPNVVLEAANASCPLVISDISTHREVFDDHDVVYTDKDSALEISKSIIMALNDPEGCERRANNAKNKVNQYSLAQSAKQYLDLYSSILKKSV